MWLVCVLPDILVMIVIIKTMMIDQMHERVQSADASDNCKHQVSSQP